MVENLLVDNIEDGKALLRELARDQLAYAIAFWLQREADDVWHFYVAPTQGVNDDAYRVVYAAIGRIPDCSITAGELRLLSVEDPMSRDAIALRDRYPTRQPKRYQRKRFGSRVVADVCIYPLAMPWKIRQSVDGQWQVCVSEFEDVWITCDSEEDAHTVAGVPILSDEALSGARAGELFVAELEKTAEVMEKYRMGFGSRFLRRRAEEVRS